MNIKNLNSFINSDKNSTRPNFEYTKKILRDIIDFLNTEYQYIIDGEFSIFFDDHRFYIKYNNCLIITGFLINCRTDPKSVTDFLTNILIYIQTAEYYSTYGPRMF